MEESALESFKKVASKDEHKRMTIWVGSIFMLIISFIVLAPWTQNVDGGGIVTTLRPEQQPHSINSLISGRVEKWFVIEGQHVKTGDTLAQISEVKTDYFNPDLLQNISDQLEAKKEALKAYKDKMGALDNNIAATSSEYKLNLSQYKNKINQKQSKVTSDSVSLKAQEVNYSIEETRLTRTDSLYSQGIKSKKDFEGAQMKYQKAYNILVSYRNKLDIARSELLNARLGYQNYTNTYAVKISKAQSDKFSSISMYSNALKEMNELMNKKANLTIRNNNYYIISPQNAYIFETYKKGLGEIVKEGDPMVSLIPAEHDLAVEIYVKPMDIPLIKIGERNRIIFDGWPSLVFSGWPNTSFGSFGGEVYAIDRNISKKGKYRVLIIPDKDEEDWPEQIKLGSGARGIFLLNDVPIWYEMWRNINGFPPDYYDGSKSQYKIDESIDKKYKTK